MILTKLKNRNIQMILSNDSLTSRQKNNRIKLIEADFEFLSKDIKINQIKISVEWKRSRAWGWNPTATVSTYITIDGVNEFEYHVGKASGCGYDKESAAIADALNQSMVLKKVLIEFAEENLLIEKPEEIFGYGINFGGYSTYPTFSGGVGTNCFMRTFKKMNYEVIEGHGKSYDYYNITRKEK